MCTRSPSMVRWIFPLVLLGVVAAGCGGEEFSGPAANAGGAGSAGEAGSAGSAGSAGAAGSSAGSGGGSNAGAGGGSGAGQAGSAGSGGAEAPADLAGTYTVKITNEDDGCALGMTKGDETKDIVFK